jgi:hypothetical protein
MIEGAPSALAALHPPPMPHGYGADTPRIEAFDLLDTRPRILGKIWLWLILPSVRFRDAAVRSLLLGAACGV